MNLQKALGPLYDGTLCVMSVCRARAHFAR